MIVGFAIPPGERMNEGVSFGIPPGERW